MAFLQAFIDDSASETGDQRLFMAGYVGTAEGWSKFSDGWGHHLKAAPSIEYLKTSEAVRLRGQFAGWTAEMRDEKMHGFERLIRDFNPVSFHCSVSREQYYRLVRPVAPRGLGNPHFVCCFGIVSSLSRFMDGRDIKTPIDFVFDQQNGVDGDIALFFDYMKNHLPTGARALIGGTPTFKDDKLFLPLQAADLLASQLRREHESLLAGEKAASGCYVRNPDMHLMCDIGESYLQSWGQQFSTMAGVEQTQSKSQWRRLKAEIVRVKALGYVPPYGTRWKNFVHAARERLSRLLALRK